MTPAARTGLELYTVFRHVILNQLIHAETLMTVLAVRKRIRETADVTGGDPGPYVHENRAVYADTIRRLLDELLPPRSLHVVLGFNAEIVVISGVRKTTVNSRAEIDELSRLRK